MNVTSLFFYKYKIIISHFASKKLFFFNFKLNFYTFFVKKSSFIYYTENALKEDAEDVVNDTYLKAWNMRVVNLICTHNRIFAYYKS